MKVSVKELQATDFSTEEYTEIAMVSGSRVVYRQFRKADEYVQSCEEIENHGESMHKLVPTRASRAQQRWGHNGTTEAHLRTS